MTATPSVVATEKEMLISELREGKSSLKESPIWRLKDYESAR